MSKLQIKKVKIQAKKVTNLLKNIKKPTKEGVREIAFKPDSWLAGSLVLFFITLILIIPAHFYSFEISLLRLFNELPNSLKPLFLLITEFGSIWVFFVLLGGLIYYKRYRTAQYISVLVTVTYAIVVVLKHLIKRPRPFEVIHGIVQRQSETPGQGFPSGHTALVTVLALGLMMLIPKKYRWTVALGIILVAISRMYLGVHAPLDVIGGFAIGASVFCFVNLISNESWRD